MLNTGHTYGTTDKTLDVLHTEKKEKLLDTLERYCIYNLSRQRLHMSPQGPTIVGTGNVTPPRYPSYPVRGGIAGKPSHRGL
jgi:hypothetical protein